MPFAKLQAYWSDAFAGSPADVPLPVEPILSTHGPVIVNVIVTESKIGAEQPLTVKPLVQRC